jgi:hypothetical protein
VEAVDTAVDESVGDTVEMAVGIGEEDEGEVAVGL